MTVYYIDPENGNDSNNGQSFANRKKRMTSGFSSGDEIRFIKSPEPTSLGNASWEKDASYDDTELNGSARDIPGCSFNGQSSGNPTTVTKSGHGLSTGDAIYSNDTAYTYAGVHQITKVDNNTFTLDGTENAADTDATSETIYKLNPFCVRLASSPIKNIICHQGLDGGGDLDWTAVDGTTGRETTNWQSGYKSARYFKAPNGVSGKLAYVQLNNALDLSGYQQISFRYLWDYNNKKTTEDYFSIRLCSDTSGDTTVHTVPIKPPCGDDTDRWGWYTHDFGTNLNSSIQSIAIHADIESNSDSTEIQIDNVIACKAKSSADSLHHGSLIGKGTTHMSNWYPILAIVDKIVLIQNSPYQHDGVADYTRPLLETTETVTTYKRECFTNPSFYNNDENGEGVFLIALTENLTISGGWNTTDMSSQDTNAGTWLGMHTSIYSAIQAPSRPGISLSNFGYVRGYQSTEIWGYEEAGGSVTNCQSIIPIFGMGGLKRTTFTNCKWFSCDPGMADSSSYYNHDSVYKDCTFTNSIVKNYSTIPRASNTYINCTFNQVGIENSFLINFLYNHVNYFYSCTFNNVHALIHGEDFQSHNSFVNCSFNNLIDIFDITDFDDGMQVDTLPNLSFINYNNTANDHRLYYMNCLVTSDATTTQSGSGYSWKFTALSTTNNKTRSAAFPLKFKLAEVYVTANSQVTATIYARRSDNNTDDYVALAALAIDNGAIGITTDAKSSALSGSVNTWVQLTLTFTPTISGVATITALMSTSSTSDNVWIDTLEIT